MGASEIFLICFVFVGVLCLVNGQPLVPALFIFGDSVGDVGNNNQLFTIVKANFPPYGRDFIGHKHTGRFCNGKLALDLTAENIGFTTYPPAYLSKEASGQNLLIGANFASASSGSGSSDFVQNYYINPLLYEKYTTDQFSDILVQSYATFVQELYGLGARKIGVATLPPLGCLPASITIFGSDSNECVAKLNKAAISFNNKLNVTSQNLQNKLSNLTLVVLDIYQPLYDLVTKPAANGFAEARRACCGTGLLETSYLCNAKSPGTCANASQYVFWDGFHPTEAANVILANDLLISGIALIS
ncbi:hypothetical protein RHMOL_Rhmol13G0133800 [Rhododendron molle]|uniref:Uncharacterized protein n=1 Tax=Rhododendron molle TaxID=49168 RepID=A0ACC0L6T3_RHOML|nr:hypothetical protein RHMOL_Rhmol13G0133800 [Rhododendron molle]